MCLGWFGIFYIKLLLIKIGKKIEMFLLVGFYVFLAGKIQAISPYFNLSLLKIFVDYLLLSYLPQMRVFKTVSKL